MIFNSALGDAEMSGDVLAGLALKNEFEDLMLSRRQISNPINGLFPESGEAVRVTRLVERLPYAAEKLFGADRLSDVVDGPGLHRLHNHGRRGVGRHHYSWKFVTLLSHMFDDIDATDPQHESIDEKATSRVGAKGGQKGRTVREYFYGVTAVIEDPADRVSIALVGFDYIYGLCPAGGKSGLAHLVRPLWDLGRIWRGRTSRVRGVGSDVIGARS
jgi:hypothetical protein